MQRRATVSPQANVQCRPKADIDLTGRAPNLIGFAQRLFLVCSVGRLLGAQFCGTSGTDRLGPLSLISRTPKSETIVLWWQSITWEEPTLR